MHLGPLLFCMTHVHRNQYTDFSYKLCPHVFVVYYLTGQLDAAKAKLQKLNSA